LFLFIIIIVFLSLETDGSYVSAGIYEPLIVVKNVSTLPHILHVGDSFDLNVTINNMYPYNIQILSFGCKGFANIIFYNNVKVIPAGSGVCTNFEPVINLKPKETKYLLAPDVTLYYKIAKPGIVKGEIQFDYYRNQSNVNELDIQNISKKYTSFISHPFSFKAFP
jgi:hypothetical protein